MPTKVYRASAPDEELAWLGDDEWELPRLLDALASWVKGHGAAFEPGRYIADVGYSSRSGAAGGGAILDAETLKAMGHLGIELHLSEYR